MISSELGPSSWTGMAGGGNQGGGIAGVEWSEGKRESCRVLPITRRDDTPSARADGPRCVESELAEGT